MNKISGKLISLFLIGFLVTCMSVAVLAAPQDSSDYTLYAKGNYTLSPSGEYSVVGNAVVNGAVRNAKKSSNGILNPWDKVVDQGLLYADDVLTNGALSYHAPKASYKGDEPNYNIDLKPFPDLAQRGILPANSTVNITESGWYTKFNVTSSGDTKVSITANQGQVIEIRADEFLLNNTVTINGSGKVIFYIDKFQSGGTPRLNLNGDSRNVMLYLSGNNEANFANTHGSFNIYAPKGTINLDGSNINIKGNIYTKGTLILGATCDITGFIYAPVSNVSMSGNSKIYGKMVANNVTVDGSAQVLKGDVYSLTGGIVDYITKPVVRKFHVVTSATAGGTITPYNADMEEGSVITITATPNDGYKFVRFEGDIPDRNGKITVTKEISVRAVFEKIGTESGYKNGLLGEYFDSEETVNETAIRMKRIDPNIAFNFGYDAPSGTNGRIEAETFSERWTGYIKVPATGEYTFKTYSDDGVKLSINGELLINRWGLVSLEFTTGNPIQLEADKFYPITVEHQQMPLYSTVFLFWEATAAGVPMQIVPDSTFFVKESVYNEYHTPKFFNTVTRTGKGLKNRFFDGAEGINATGTTPQYEEIGAVNYEWRGGTPGNSPAIGDAFSARMTGTIEGKFTEEMTLEFIVDDGIRVWVDDAKIIDSWKPNSDAIVKGNFNMKVGTKHKITIEYNDLGGGATCIMRWKSASQELQVVPVQYLYAE